MPTATTTKLTSVDDRRAGRIMEYLSARAEWRSHNPQPEKSSNPELYESFLGPRGPAMKRKVDLICKGYLSMELLQAISFKDKVSDLFLSLDRIAPHRRVCSFVRATRRSAQRITIVRRPCTRKPSCMGCRITLFAGQIWLPPF